MLDRWASHNLASTNEGPFGLFTETSSLYFNNCNQPTVHEELFPFSVRPHGESSFHAILSEKYYEPSIMLDNRPELYMEVLHFLTFHKRLFNLHIIAMTFTDESTNEFLLIVMRNFVLCFIRMLHIYPTGAVCCLHFPPGVAVDSIRATEAFTVWRVIKTNHCNNYDKLISRGLKALSQCACLIRFESPFITVV